MNNIICLKWGNKYSADYVNNLYDMVKRNITSPFKFYCFTDDPTGIEQDIIVKPLLTTNTSVKTWWHKLAFFQETVADIEGTVLFLDLDVVILDNIDCFFKYEGEFCIIKEWNGESTGRGGLFNSSVFRFVVGNHVDIWESYLEVRPDSINDGDPNVTMHGDQNWISHVMENKLTAWPEDWCKSFKYAAMDKKDPMETNTKIAIFHGIPNPSEAAIDYTRKQGPAPWILSTWGSRDLKFSIIEDGPAKLIEASTTQFLVNDKALSEYGEEKPWKYESALFGLYRQSPWRWCVGNTLHSIRSYYLLDSLTFPQVQSTLSKWFKYLRPGGKLEIKVLNSEPYLSNHENIDGIIRMLGQDLEDPLPVKSFYSIKLIKKMLKSAGFTNTIIMDYNTSILVTAEKPVYET